MELQSLERKMVVYRLQKAKNKSLELLWSIVRLILIVGTSFTIVYPLLRQLSMAFKDKVDIYNPVVYMIPMNYTLENIKYAMGVLKYWPTLGNTLLFVTLTMILQTISCALAGYGFARYRFPGSNILFALVVMTILIPMSTLMVPMYLHFRTFDILGIIQLITGKEGLNLLNTYWPMLIMSATANGLKSGLYIYIFRQFFRGLPKEIEEAALIDGAGGFKTFFQIMLPNAIPSIVTVALFAFVWQYNDTFFASLFMANTDLMANRIASLPADTSLYLPTLMGFGLNPSQRADPNHVAMIVDTGILMAILPLIIMYLFVQRYFVESVERTGVVG